MSDTRCPECGRVFDPDDPSSYSTSPPLTGVRVWLDRSLILLLFVATLASGLPLALGVWDQAGLIWAVPTFLCYLVYLFRRPGRLAWCMVLIVVFPWVAVDLAITASLFLRPTWWSEALGAFGAGLACVAAIWFVILGSRDRSGRVPRIVWRLAVGVCLLISPALMAWGFHHARTVEKDALTAIIKQNWRGGRIKLILEDWANSSILELEPSLPVFLHDRILLSLWFAPWDVIYAVDSLTLRTTSLRFSHDPDGPSAVTLTVDQLVENVSRIRHLRMLQLHSPDLTNEHAATLSQLKQLEELRLSGGELGDKAMSEIGQLTSLRRLDLPKTSLGDAGLAHLTELKQLEWLDISRTNVTGPGLVHLQSLPQLSTIILFGTDLTDEGLGHLAQMPALSHVNLYGCEQLTGPGLRQLIASESLRNLQPPLHLHDLYSTELFDIINGKHRRSATGVTSSSPMNP